MNLFGFFQLLAFRRKWRKLNKHNFTFAKNIFNPSKVVVKNASYGALEVYAWLDNDDKLYIENYVSISSNVKFIIDGGHNTNYLSTYPFEAMFLEKKIDSNITGKGSIIVESDVWIGMNNTILSGVKIGQGAVIAAGSVVTKDVPPYAIVAGNPAKVIKYRFSEDIIQRLLKIDFNKIDKNFVQNNINLFYTQMDEGLLEQIEQRGINGN